MFEDMFEKARTEMVKDNATKRELTKDTKINLKQVLDAGKPEGTVTHRKNGDFIKQGGEWKPYKDGNRVKENNTKNQVLKSSADKISKRSGGKFKLTENKDPAKKGKYELKIGNKSYMVNSTEEAENFVDGYMEGKERTGSKPAIPESSYGFTRGAKHYSRAKENENENIEKEKLMQKVRKTWKPIHSPYYDADRAIESPDGKVSVHEVKPGRLYNVKKPGGMYTLISKSIESAAVYAIKHSR